MPACGRPFTLLPRALERGRGPCRPRGSRQPVTGRGGAGVLRGRGTSRTARQERSARLTYTRVTHDVLEGEAQRRPPRRRRSRCAGGSPCARPLTGSVVLEAVGLHREPGAPRCRGRRWRTAPSRRPAAEGSGHGCPLDAQERAARTRTGWPPGHRACPATRRDLSRDPGHRARIAASDQIRPASRSVPEGPESATASASVEGERSERSRHRAQRAW